MSESTKRPIDRLRDSAVSMQIDDGSEIVAMVAIGSVLHTVTGRGVYAIRLADDTDPGRSNPAIPNSQQRVLASGADDPLVAKLLLTAHRLFRRTYLGDAFDEGRAMLLAFELTKDVTAMAGIRSTLEKAQDEAMVAFRQAEHIGNDLKLPTIGNAEALFDAFAQKLGHAIDTLRKVARLLYDDMGKKWIDALAKLTLTQYGPEDSFAKYMSEVRPALLFMRELRNRVEHPRP
ncbi:MAG: hypothetical protein L0219_02120, partial [Phycisphaerales bacterium]|nr:hypothetical protein [Phycisphaerales bacterium]